MGEDLFGHTFMYIFKIVSGDARFFVFVIGPFCVRLKIEKT